MDSRYKERREGIEELFTPENRKNEPVEVHRSPSGIFELEVAQYSTGPNTWECSRGIVRRLSDGAIVADIKRNFGNFWHAWVTHPNGRQYLLCGEDYQGYSVVALQEAQHHRYFPEAGYQGAGFCWAAVYPSPDGTILAVDGCYWACPYELVIYDFANPEQLPLPEIERVDDVYACEGWQPDGTFAFQRSYWVRASDGARLDSLPAYELDAIQKQTIPTLEKRELSRWKRSS